MCSSRPLVLVAALSIDVCVPSVARAEDAEEDDLHVITVRPAEGDASEATVLGEHVAHGGYGAPAGKITTLADGPAILAGVEGGWIVAHRVVLGGAVYGLANDVASPPELQPAGGGVAHLGFLYGGPRFGFVAAPTAAVHARFGLLVGGGTVTSESTFGEMRRSDGSFVIEPDAAVETNLARHVRVVTGLSWRFARPTTGMAGFSATALSGPALTLAVAFGSF